MGLVFISVCLSVARCPSIWIDGPERLAALLFYAFLSSSMECRAYAFRVELNAPLAFVLMR